MSTGRWSIVFLVILSAVGVMWFSSPKNGSTKNYTPSQAVSEDAVRMALEAWKAGLPVGILPDTKPQIFVSDGERKPNQLLDSYTILGEVHGNAGRSYAVTLNLTNPQEVVKTKYLVVGIDPLWVFRQQDYDLLMHWDHHMAPSDATDENSVAPK